MAMRAEEGQGRERDEDKERAGRREEDQESS